MFSYAYMKILESRPWRYDRGMALLSLGQALKAQRRLVDENVGPGAELLDVGCGTATAAILAARRGARVLGVDISRPMLDVAAAKIGAAGVRDRVELAEMGIAGMDKLEEARFDLVMSTFVFSELSPAEQEYALEHAYRTLKPGGRLAVADEARPRNRALRVLHGLIRIPLLLVTFVLTQTATSTVDNLAPRIRRAGFRIVEEQRSLLGSLVYLVAVKDPPG